MRAVIYARFSSDLQDERSIADQVHLARKYAETRGLAVIDVYQDAAISGASTINRPGLQRMLVDASASKFDIIVTESLDRLSRSQADIASLYEKLTFNGVRIETLADGAVSEIHVGLKGTMAALFLKDLAQKTRRGQVGRVKAGRIPGGKSYGYDIVKGGEDRGQRTINADEAAVVRRIFAAYAEGKGPLAIVAELNREAIPGPRGGRWNASALLGNPKRRNGILNNELYRGMIVYNRQRFLKDPATGKRVSRENPDSEWLRQEVPALLLIDEETWQRVQSRRAARGGPQLHHRRRPRRLLSGLLKCACCGGTYTVVQDERMRCSTLQNSGSCTNTRTIKTSEVEQRVLAALRKHLLAPDVVAEAVEAYAQERQKLANEHRKRRNELTRELGVIERKLKHVMEMVMDGHSDRRTLGRQLAELEAEQDRIEAELSAGSDASPVALHPQAAERYRAKVAQIHEALTKGDAASLEAIMILRDLIDHILVTPTERPAPVELRVVGNLAALLVENTPGNGVAVSMVAGACNRVRYSSGHGSSWRVPCGGEFEDRHQLAA
jgi:DNA invertase Pin-like site-specific DNA recombinase